MISIQAVDAISSHRFNNAVKRLKIDLQKLQVLAISHQSDIEVKIFHDKKGLVYRVVTEEPSLAFETEKVKKLQEISSMSLGKKHNIRQIDLYIFSSGRIEPSQKIEFHRKNTSLCMDLSQPLLIKLLG